MQYIYKYQSPIGGITIASDGDSLTGLWFDGQKYFAASLSPEHEEKALPVFEQTKEWLDCYFSGKNPGFMPDIHLEGTPFRLSVWKILKQSRYIQGYCQRNSPSERTAVHVNASGRQCGGA